MNYENLTGIQKVALLFLRINHSSMNDLLKYLPSSLILRIAKEKENFKSISHEVMNKILEEYYDFIQEKDNLLFPDNIDQSYVFFMLKDELSQIDTVNIGPIFIQQSAQIQAVILAQCSNQKKVELLKLLPEKSLGDVLSRMSKLKNIDVQNLHLLQTEIEKSLLAMGPQSNRKYSGMKMAQEMLDQLDPVMRKKILSKISSQIHYEEFPFSRIMSLGPIEMKLLLRKVPRELLLVAMRKIQPEILDKVTENMSIGAKKIFLDDLACGKKEKYSDVLKAQESISKIIEELVLAEHI